MRDDRHRRIRHREIDHDVGVRFADDAQRHADFADAGDQARIFAQQRMIGRLERRHDLEIANLSPPARSPAAPSVRPHREWQVS